MNTNFHLERQNQHFSVTAFPKIMGIFLQEDILQYKDNIDDLTEAPSTRIRIFSNPQLFRSGYGYRYPARQRFLALSSR